VDALELHVQRARLAEQDARRERDRLDLILDYVADPIVVTDVHGTVVQANRPAERLLPAGDGATADGATAGGGAHEGARDGASRARNREALAGFVREFAAGTEAVRGSRLALANPATGTALPVEIVAGRIAGRPGEPPVIVSVLHDLTTQAENERLYEELKRFSSELERRVHDATADLAEQNVRLQAQSRELERANRLKSEFLASMSHELRTPINALIGYTALMLDRIYGELAPKQEEGLRRIQHSAQQLLTLVNDILDLAKIEAGRLAVHLEPSPVGPIVREAVMLAERAARTKGLALLTELPADLPLAHTDANKLRQALQNLLSNAIKFTPEGSVTVRAAAEGARVRVDVIDTGIGIRAEDLEAIWADFRQLDQSRTREYGGTGLGLSIVRRLVERLEGEVRVASVPGAGSVFSVLVPTAAGAHDAAAGHAASAAPSGPRLVDDGPRRAETRRS
jgi:signal transduction histidine kinase